MRNEQSVYEDSDVQLDGNEFHSCTFRRCRLVYSGGALPTIVGCGIHDSRFVLRDAAGRTAGMLRAIAGMGGMQLLFETLQLQVQAPPPSSDTQH